MLPLIPINVSGQRPASQLRSVIHPSILHQHHILQVLDTSIPLRPCVWQHMSENVLCVDSRHPGH